MPIDTPFTAGYVLVKSGIGDVHELRANLLELEGVRVVHALIGPDDLICYVDTLNASEFRRALDRGVRRLIDDGLIERTETMMILAESGNGYHRDVNRPAAAAAWLFCDIGVGDPQPVVDELLTIPGVQNAHAVLGRCDVVAYVEAASQIDLMRALDGHIRKVRHIVRTDTRLVFMDTTTPVEDRRRTEQKPLGLGP